jgi:hypothetical protein
MTGVGPMMKMIKCFFERLKEPSTYAGIASCLAGLGLLGLTKDEWDQILGALVALVGVVAIFLKERPSIADDDHSVSRRNYPEDQRRSPCGPASSRARIRN